LAGALVVLFDQSPTPAEADEILCSAVIVWLVSVHPSGRPHIVPVWFHWDGADMIILTQPGAQKVKNLQHDPRVSIAVDNSDEGHSPVVFEGMGTLESHMIDQDRLQSYLEKYAGLLANMDWSGERMLAHYSQAIRVTPHKFLTIT
jgi:PPOX class probable F420-dependent enzyme